MGIEALGLLVLGSVAGCVAAFLILLPQIRAAAESARQAAEAERAALAERLRGRDELLAQTRMDLAGLGRSRECPPLCGK